MHPDAAKCSLAYFYTVTADGLFKEVHAEFWLRHPRGAFGFSGASGSDKHTGSQTHPMNHRTSALATPLLFLPLFCTAAETAQQPALLPKDARLAIVGDSITEQKLYSKFIETYF